MNALVVILVIFLVATSYAFLIQPMDDNIEAYPPIVQENSEYFFYLWAFICLFGFVLAGFT